MVSIASEIVMSSFDFDDQDSIEELNFKQRVYARMIEDGETEISIDSESAKAFVELLNEALAAGRISQDKMRFFRALMRYPSLVQLWDLHKIELDIEAAEMYLKGCSAGEALIAKFFFMVWIGEDKYGFNLIEATRKLDFKSLEIIAEWIIDPFWP